MAAGTNIENMTRRELIITILVLVVCGAAFVIGTILISTGHVAPAPTNGLP